MSFALITDNCQRKMLVRHTLTHSMTEISFGLNDTCIEGGPVISFFAMCAMLRLKWL
jgi:hypothetical protein